MKRKLFFCERCQRVYAADVNNGTCQEIVGAAPHAIIRCGGTIRPIDYERSKTLPGQMDIEDAIGPAST